MKKKGFTLIELMVYIAIVGIVVLVAGQAFSDSTKMRVRTQNMLRANQVAENVGTLFKEDVSQMGSKGSKEKNSSVGADSFYVATDVFINPTTDKSSFNYTMGNTGDGDSRKDKISFKKVRYQNDGKYSGIEEIEWYVENGTLYRSCKTLDGTNVTECPKDGKYTVAITDGVERFKIIPAKPNVLTADVGAQMFPTVGKSFRLISRIDGASFFNAVTTPAEGGETVSISGFVSNFDQSTDEIAMTRKANQLYVAEANANAGSWSDLCFKLTLAPSTEYEVSFMMLRLDQLDYSQTFVAGRDHMAVGFRKSDGSTIADMNDYAFFPPASDDAVTRVMHFFVKNEVQNACLAFTFASYSPSVNMGNVIIQDLKVRKISADNYKFDDGYDPVVADKKNVRAFLLNMSLKKGGESGEVSQVVFVPSNGAE